MDQSFIAAADLEKEFRSLTQSVDWSRMSKTWEVADAFNVFRVLDDAVCENSWSRILAALFTSSGSHNLEMLPLEIWLSLVGDRRFKPLGKRAVSSVALCEWGTMERRRLDILIKLLDPNGRLIGVVGVENKVWSGEQHNQLQDYQEALCEQFPDVPKILIFLTPDEREPLTGVKNRSCSCRPCSYGTLVKMCDRVLSSAPKGTNLLLSSLHDFIDRNILATGIMKTKIEAVVRRLYRNREHRNVLEAIFEHRPTLEGVCDRLKKAAEDYSTKSGIKCSYDQWPARAANPPEIKFWVEPLSKSGFYIHYMFRSKVHHPFIGDSFSILIAAWCESAAARKRIKNLNVRLPKRMTHNFRDWSGWSVMWEGDSYELRDLNGRDARNLSRMLIKTISKTCRPLKLAVSKA